MSKAKKQVAKKEKSIVNIESPRKLIRAELDAWKDFRDSQDWKIDNLTVSEDIIMYIWEMYQDIFNVTVAKPILNNCPRPLIKMMNGIDELYNECK